MKSVVYLFLRLLGSPTTPPECGSVAINVKVKILFRDRLVGSIFEQIGERIVQGVFQISISLSEAYCSRTSQDLCVGQFGAAKFVALTLWRLQETNAGLCFILKACVRRPDFRSA